MDAGSENQATETGSTEVAARGAFVERRAKAKLALAAEHFNRDYKKGFQFLQVVAKPLTPWHCKFAPGSFAVAEYQPQSQDEQGSGLNLPLLLNTSMGDYKKGSQSCR